MFIYKPFRSFITQAYLLFRVCNYFNNGEQCPQGDKCSFAHMLPAPSLKSPFAEMLNGPARLEPVTSTRKNSIDLNKQDSGYTSNGSANHPIATDRSVSSDSPVYTQDYRTFFNKMMVSGLLDSLFSFLKGLFYPTILARPIFWLAFVFTILVAKSSNLCENLNCTCKISYSPFFN